MNEKQAEVLMAKALTVAESVLAKRSNWSRIGCAGAEGETREGNREIAISNLAAAIFARLELK